LPPQARLGEAKQREAALQAEALKHTGSAEPVQQEGEVRLVG
jgi:hypothetical protein